MTSLIKSSFFIRSNHRQRGSTLIVTLITLAVLAAAVSAVSVSVSTTANVSLQAASWQEAIMAAEAGADTAMASFRVALDEATYWNTIDNALSDQKTGATAWAGWAQVSPSPTPSPGPTPTKLSYSTVLRPATGADTALQAAVYIEKLSVSDPNGTWYRVRSTGVAGVSGPPRVGADKRDSDLRKISLLNSRLPLSGFPNANLTGGVRQTSRSIELLVKPLPKGLWDRAITVGTTVDISSKFTIDSFDSSDPTKSKSAVINGVTVTGIYDPTKRQSNADIASNDIGSHVKIGHAYLYGDLTYNTGTATGTDHVQGTISNNHYQQLVGIPTPDWDSSTNLPKATPTAITKVSTTLNGGPQNNPARYKLSDLTLQSGNVLTFQDTGSGSSKYVEIWVTKDVNMSGTSQIIIPEGFNVKIYVAGKFSMSGGSFSNQTNRAANLTVYGIDTGDTTTPLWAYGSDADFVGTIYGTSIEFKVTGAANFYGAVLVNKVAFGGTVDAGFHFDEALLKGGTNSSTQRYQVASWIEDVR